MWIATWWNRFSRIAQLLVAHRRVDFAHRECKVVHLGVEDFFLSRNFFFFPIALSLSVAFFRRIVLECASLESRHAERHCPRPAVTRFGVHSAQFATVARSSSCQQLRPDLLVRTPSRSAVAVTQRPDMALQPIGSQTSFEQRGIFCFKSSVHQLHDTTQTMSFLTRSFDCGNR